MEGFAFSRGWKSRNSEKVISWTKPEHSLKYFCTRSQSRGRARCTKEEGGGKGRRGREEECNIDANRGFGYAVICQPPTHAFCPAKLLRESFHGSFSSVSHPHCSRAINACRINLCPWYNITRSDACNGYSTYAIFALRLNLKRNEPWKVRACAKRDKTQSVFYISSH